MVGNPNQAAEGIRRRSEILGFMARRAGEGDGLPTVREIGAAVGLKSTKSVHDHLSRLEDEGYVERSSRGGARSTRLTEKGWEYLGQRVRPMGRAAAGPGIEAISDEGGTSSLASDLLVSRSGKRRYTVTAHGDSMTGARIEEGDTLLVEENEDPPDGTVVLALLHGHEVTVKRIYRDGNRVRLRWQNGKPREMVLPADEVRVQGEVIRVIIEPAK